ncbi:DUF481 domain-containing protein [Chitinophaga sp. sic0106]|uniref:DUF481 domain-containing protein n=1 Tax=Chitinophaga sp. sic0106 TaxID=2854785 RepID=UPI001C47B9CD|nr:DUF481 domain-containing protein [Chitinophaga sp. sic0106]MBV7529736.1 DUF481 domain-containing protein [Chitinophaga sp. sic0106]
MALVKWLVTILLLCSGWQAMAQHLEPDVLDEIELYNGDKITGKLKQIQRGELTFDGDKLGDLVTIKLRDIKYIAARRKEYLIETVQTLRYVGILLHGISPGWVRVVGKTDTIALAIQDLDQIENLDQRFWTRLDGNASLGYSYSRSSNIGRINESHSMTYSTRKWLFVTTGDLMYTMDEGYRGIEKADLALQGYFEFWKRLFAITNAQYQRSTELGLNARYQIAEAVGPIVLKNRRHDLRVASGISGQKEYSTDTTNRGKSITAEIPVFVSYYLYRLGKPEIKLQFSNGMYFSLTDKGRFRLDQNVTLYWKIISHLSANVQVYVDYDTKPPNVDAQKVDYGTVFSIGYSF